jgi:hypothetical protein
MGSKTGYEITKYGQRTQYPLVFYLNRFFIGLLKPVAQEGVF